MAATASTVECKTTTGQETQADSDARGAAHPRWAVVLAGGDGQRLLPLTRRLSGDDRPKQFCRLLGPDTLLDQTLRRVGRVVSPQRTFSVVTKSHERFYSGQYGTLLVQPFNQGTGPAIACSLARLRGLDPEAVVGFFPSDHHYADDEAFAVCVNEAFQFAELHSEAVVLLGITASHPETGYGWIEPGKRAMAVGQGKFFTVRGFWEKPSRATAIELMRRGCVWNSFVMFGRLEAFSKLIRRTVPYLLDVFHAIGPAPFTEDEEASLLKVYQSIAPSSFTREVLSICPGNLAVACSDALEWTDVGEVGRALALIGGNSLRLPPRMKTIGEQKPARILTATA